MPRLRDRYHKEVVPALIKEFGFRNPMQAPRLLKISVNMGIAEAGQNNKSLEAARAELAAITGQQPVIARARKAIANFKLRQGQPIGLFVTLRRDRMWEFLDRLVSVALPRVRDFRGVATHGFDGNGNYNLGIKEHIIFPEIQVENTEKIRGMNIAITTSTDDDKVALAMLKRLGMPFRA